MKGVVLAAGKGTRLYPVTKAIPKPLLPIANRPTLDYAFDRIKECGITEVCIVVGENRDAIESALGDGGSRGLRLTYAVQEEPRGLAHAVACSRDAVGDDDFLLYLGDAIYQNPIEPYVRQFRESGCANLNLVKQVEDPRRFGVASLEGDRMVKLVEKPEKPESNWAMAGMYVFSAAVWPMIERLTPSARGELEISDAIQLMIESGQDVRAGKYVGEWFDTGTLDSFLATSRFLVGNGTLIADGAEVFAELGEHVVVGEGAVVEAPSLSNTVVLPEARVQASGPVTGCLIGGEVTFSVPASGLVVFGDLEKG